MTCQHTMTLGVYLLGALDPVERSAFESHLSYCDICRVELVRLSPLPGLLNQITMADFAEELPPTGAEGGTTTRVPVQSRPVLDPLPPVTDPVPAQRASADDEPSPTERASKPRASRFWQVAGIAAAVVVLAAGAFFGWRAIREPVAPPQAEGVTWSVTQGAASAEARLVDHEWGTEIQSKIHGLPSDRECYLVVYDAYGNREVAGWWGTDHDPEVEIPGSTSFQSSKIVRLEYLLDDKETVALTIQAPHR